MLPSDWLSQSHEKRSNQLWSEEIREVLIDQLIDQWGEESFPASDPPGRLPPSLGDALPHSEESQVHHIAESDSPVVEDHHNVRWVHKADDEAPSTGDQINSATQPV